MAEERSESREVTWRQLLPWTELFRAFQVSLDLNKRKATDDEVKAAKDLSGQQKQVVKDALPLNEDRARAYRAKSSQYARLGQIKPYGLLAVSPWNEDRGPNPFLLVTGQAGIP